MTTMYNDSLQRLAERYGQAWNTQSLDEIMAMHTAGTDVITTAGDLVHRKETYLDIAAALRQLGLLDGQA